MKLTKLTLAAAAALVISGAAMAADEPPKFGAADANGDGGVDMAEFKATAIEREFGKLDEDGDGKLNQDEYATALEEDCEEASAGRRQPPRFDRDPGCRQGAGVLFYLDVRFPG